MKVLQKIHRPSYRSAAYFIGFLLAGIFSFVGQTLAYVFTRNWVHRTADADWGFAAAIVVRLVALVLFFLHLSAKQTPYTMGASEYPIAVLLLAGMEGPGMYEASARSKSRSVTVGRPDDPFDRAPLRQSEQGLYSIGPDGIDQGMSLQYDPTNGTVSPGDIPALSR